MFRDFTKDPLKSPSEIHNARGRLCCVEHCGNSVTRYKGPGQENHCRAHQKNLMEYGGTGKVGVVNSHARGRFCNHCGYAPEDDPAVIGPAGDNLILLNRLMRSLLETDHLDGDPTNNSPENLDTKCVKCHKIKTILNEDYLTRKNN